MCLMRRHCEPSAVPRRFEAVRNLTNSHYICQRAKEIHTFQSNQKAKLVLLIMTTPKSTLLVVVFMKLILRNLKRTTITDSQDLVRSKEE